MVEALSGSIYASVAKSYRKTNDGRDFWLNLEMYNASETNWEQKAKHTLRILQTPSGRVINELINWLILTPPLSSMLIYSTLLSQIYWRQLTILPLNPNQTSISHISNWIYPVQWSWDFWKKAGIDTDMEDNVLREDFKKTAACLVEAYPVQKNKKTSQLIIKLIMWLIYQLLVLERERERSIWSWVIIA